MNNQKQVNITNNVCFSLVDTFSGSTDEKNLVFNILNEWNNQSSLLNLCKLWEKKRPENETENLLFLLYNCECLSTHLSDLDILLSTYLPHVIILTGVGSQIRRMPSVPNYYWHNQKGTNSFGGVSILIHSSIKSKVIHAVENFLLIEMDVAMSSIFVGAVYVPPGQIPPFEEFEKFLDKNFYIFGDFNAKHTQWGCQANNSSGISLNDWLEERGCVGMFPEKPTSRRSNAIIDFAITQDKSGWSCDVIDEGTSDHFPVIFASPITSSEKGYFRKTNWKVFSFILSCLYKYWNSSVYNMDEQDFFLSIFTFLASLWDRTSIYLPINKYRPPWPHFLVSLAREVNRKRKKYRRSRFLYHYDEYIAAKNTYVTERAIFEQEKREKQLQHISRGMNVWKFVRPLFHPFTPPFQGLTIKGKIERDKQKIADQLGTFFEHHFSKPTPDTANEIHNKYMTAYDNIAHLPNMPLNPITYMQVYMNWKKFSPKKSLDSMKTSAYLLKNLPIEYLNVFTVLFNKSASKGIVFKDSKHAKVICLSKDGTYPEENKLRPISLLPNIGKWYERCVHDQIMRWCNEKNIFVDEQSGFTPNRRLQSRILTLCEDLRLTAVACNRPALVIFIDFLSAFDRVYHPALISNLVELETPLPIVRWIYQWLEGRTMQIHHGNAISKTIKIFSGAPQGSVLSATLFRLHIHFLPKIFARFSSHLFADDVALVIKGSIEKNLHKNISDIERQAAVAMNLLEQFPKNLLLPVNVKKTKMMLVHTAVAPPYPTVYFDDEQIDIVSSFRYLGVDICTKMGWGVFISKRLAKIRNIYSALRKMYRTIPIDQIKVRKKLFCAFALPHFCWLFVTWFFFTENQKQKIEHLFCTGIRQMHNLWGWNDIVTLILAREKSLLDYVYDYWKKLMKHIIESPEGNEYAETWEAYLICTSQNKDFYKSMGLRCDNLFMNRLAQRAHHTNLDLFSFLCTHEHQKDFLKKSNVDLVNFIQKYVITE